MSLIVNRLIGFGARRASSGGRTNVREKTIDTSITTLGGSTYMFVNKEWAVDNGATVYEMGAYMNTHTPTLKFKIFKFNSSGNYDVVYSEGTNRVHGGGGWQWWDITTPYTVPGSGVYRAGFAVIVGGDISVSTATTGDLRSGGDASGNGVVFDYVDYSGGSCLVGVGY